MWLEWKGAQKPRELIFTGSWGLLADETKPFGRLAFNVGCGLVSGSSGGEYEYPGTGNRKDPAWKHGFKYGLVVGRLWGDL